MWTRNVGRWWLILFFTLFFLSPLHSEDRFSRLYFEQYSLESGLSHTLISCITQDRYGFLWFGTHDGLNRFDGLNFSVYKNNRNDPNSLSENRITSLLNDSNGNLWVGSYGGLDLFLPESGTFRHYIHHESDPTSLMNTKVDCLLEDRRKNLWAAGTLGLNRKEKTDDGFRHYPFPEMDGAALDNFLILSMQEDPNRDGIIWVGTRNGLYLFDEKQGFIAHYQNHRGDPRSLSNDFVFTIAPSPVNPGRLWIGTENGLNDFDPTIGRFQRIGGPEGRTKGLSSSRIRTILFIRNDPGRIWIGTDGGGINIFNTDNRQWQSYQFDPLDANSLRQNSIISLFEDQSGNIWIGTSGAGVNKMNPRKGKFIHYKNNPFNSNSLAKDDVLSIFASRKRPGILWVGNQGGGLNELNKTTGKYIHYHSSETDGVSISNESVTSLLEDSEGRLWIATRDGLDIFDPATGKTRHLRNDQKNTARISGNYIRTLYQDSSGRIWLGTRGDGLNLYESGTGKFRVFRFNPSDPNSLGSSIIQSICESPLNKNLFWIGTDQGITRFDLKQMKFQRFSHDPGNSNSLSNNTVMHIHQPILDPDLLWVCTYGGGLSQMRISTGEWTHFTEKDGLPGDLVYSMLDEKDNKGKPTGVFWLSTGRGLSRFDSHSNTFNNFGLSDGVMVSDFNYGAWHYGPDGRMYFGGTGGLMEFDPRQIATNQTPPPVFITSFKVFDQEMLPGLLSSPGQRFEMNYRRNFFSFEFAALDYSSPAKNLYACKMEGIDPDWVYRTASRRDATYTSVPPGEYKFRVRASNSDGVWNEEGSLLNIIVTPPFWQTGWFITISILAGILAVISIYRWRVGQLTKRKKILEELVNERTYQLDLANRELQKLATQDYLTGIANHRRFSDFLSSEWKRAIRQKKPISIILIDVDDFKMFNDTYGHQAGDECLKRIAHVLDEHSRRPSDLAARYGGEEFIIILADTPLDGAIKVAEVMKKGVEDLHIPHESSRAAPFVTISLGCSTFHPTREDESMMLIHAADAALYQSKKEGRNRISVGSI